jgi:hypothetical protein
MTSHQGPDKPRRGGFNQENNTTPVDQAVGQWTLPPRALLMDTQLPQGIMSIKTKIKA